MAVPAYKNTTGLSMAVPVSEGITITVNPGKYIAGPHFSAFPANFPGLVLVEADSADVTPQSDIVYYHTADPTEISGYSGAVGYSGYSGAVGTSGYSGYSGISGYSGPALVTAVSGYSGVSGVLDGTILTVWGYTP